jgi:hypothetical protein
VGYTRIVGAPDRPASRGPLDDCTYLEGRRSGAGSGGPTSTSPHAGSTCSGPHPMGASCSRVNWRGWSRRTMACWSGIAC